MKTQNSPLSYLVIFVISFITIALELFLTRILYLKAWNHVVYLVIPFAILGYGIGANFCMIFKDRLLRADFNTICGRMCLWLSACILVCTFMISQLAIKVEYLLNLLHDINAIIALTIAYTFFMAPFILIGFLIVFIFSRFPREVSRLYFIDMLGAGSSAAAFYFLIDRFAVLPSILIIAFSSALLGLILLNQKKWKLLLAVGLFLIISFVAPQDLQYKIDERKGWEWIPGYFSKETYKQTVSRWHPLGRTDVYRMIDESKRKYLFDKSPGTFQINVLPRPEFAYFSTNFLAGTPAYNLSPEGMNAQNSRITPFLESMETPYLFFEKPKVVVIGAGGGRDIFMANVHGASEVVGAEINPAIVEAMQPGGAMYEYSGKVYTMGGAKIFAMDGRHLLKQIPENHYDMVILNGVDTFSGLSSGAYAYAESYLYTKNAVKEYLRVLNNQGMITIVRWLFKQPRETLRLHAIALEAMEEMGIENPTKNIFIGAGNGWALMMIRKVPFTEADLQKIDAYLTGKTEFRIYPATEELKKSGHPYLNFQVYSDYFEQNKEHVFAHFYPFDISVITDDNPFFYKYYRLRDFNPFKVFATHHSGSIIFLTQIVIFFQALFFIALFIFIPLMLLKNNDIRQLPKSSVGPFILYFSSLGVGFMLIEIPLMQKFVLLLGSPIYSITVILSALLISTGIGSLMANKFLRGNFTYEKLVTAAGAGVVIYTLLLITVGFSLTEHLMGLSFLGRALATTGFVFPLGFLLGIFFPAGLDVISQKYNDTIAWAWAINGGFSVLGSIVAISLAQFNGFNAVLFAGCICYLVAILSFSKLFPLVKS